MRAGRIQSLDRGLSIIDLLARSDGALSVGEIAQALDLNVSTVSRLAATLRERGIIAQYGRGGRYALGLSLFRYAHEVSQGHPLIAAAGPAMEAVHHELDETVSLSVPADDGVLFVLCYTPDDRVVRVRIDPGTVLPYSTTAAGKAMLACMPADVLSSVIQRGLVARTPSSITDPERLRDEIAAASEKGFAVDLGESEVDVGCVSVAVLDDRSQLVGAVSCSQTIGRLTSKRIDGVQVTLARAARHIEEVMSRRRSARSSAVRREFGPP